MLGLGKGRGSIGGGLFFGGASAATKALFYSNNGAPTHGSSGTLATIAPPGSSLFDTTNGISYFNIGTKAAPVWTPLSPVSFAISSANILAMNGASVNLIVAPPAGYAVLVDNILFTMTRTATAYANGGVVTFIYTGGIACHTGSVPASVVTTGGAGVALTQLGPGTGANGLTVPTATGIDITNGTAAFITGTGTAKAILDYRIVAQ